MEDNHLDFYASLESLLRYHEEIGLGPVALNDEIRSFLSTRPPVPVQVLASLEVGVPKSSGRMSTTESTPSSRSERFAFTLDDIGKDVESCSACNLHERRVYPVAGRGEKPVRLMVVGDWLAIAGDGPAAKGQLFGIQQDQMLFRMLTAMKLPVDEVFITNVIKCGLPEKTQPKAAHVQACVGYLKKQIQVLRPEYICTMGMVAARAVLERSLPLSRLRGKFHDYTLGPDAKIPVLTTYHPSYLLQNPEMKQATWADLQYLAQKMGLLAAK